MWTYFQRTGGIVSPEGVVMGEGYSGFDAGKNNPDLEHVKGLGPLPEGFYTMTELFDSEIEGPDCIRLLPDPDNEMFGRVGFLIHGDNPEHIGCSSHGCIILGKPIRRYLWGDPDHRLCVKR